MVVGDRRKSMADHRASFMATCLPLVMCFVISGCAILPSSGPQTEAVKNAGQQAVATAPIKVVDVTESTTQAIVQRMPLASFAETLGDGVVTGSIVDRGDTLSITIWEAPPAVLFASSGGGLLPMGTSVRPVSEARNADLPEQMVSEAGTITIPFVGTVDVAGRTTDAIAQEIRSRLVGKAHDPQVLVRRAHNATSNVTVVGEVSNNIRLALTAKGERLLDAFASAGGVRQPVGKMTVQVTRGDKVSKMPLSAVIKDPRQNIRLQANDIITLLFQPYSFTVLGAASRNEEVPFEETGLTLSQALGRMGGLQDQRANPRGAFIFRFEDPAVFASIDPAQPLQNGKIPVIYRVDLKDPKTLFVAQIFPIKDKDVIYISNAPLNDFSKFLQVVSQIIYPIATIQNAF